MQKEGKPPKKENENISPLAEEEKEEKEATRLEEKARDTGVYLEPTTPEKVFIEELDLSLGNVSIIWGDASQVKENRQLALSLCHYLLCGNCGSISRLSNGEAVLDSNEVKAHKAGELRELEKVFAELENRVRYLNRRWRQNKQGYSELTEETKKLEEMEHSLARRRNELAPIQFWCSACTWEWPEDRPWQIQ